MAVLYLDIRSNNLLLYVCTVHVMFVGYVASPSFLERVCNLVKEVRDHNPSVMFGTYVCYKMRCTPNTHKHIHSQHYKYNYVVYNL